MHSPLLEDFQKSTVQYLALQLDVEPPKTLSAHYLSYILYQPNISTLQVYGKNWLAKNYPRGKPSV